MRFGRPFVLFAAILISTTGSCSRSDRVSPQVRPTALRFDKKDLPGEYQGGGTGVGLDDRHLTLEPSGRFTFKSYCCFGEYNSNLGTWSLDGDLVLLHPEKPNKHEVFSAMNVRFVPVKWGKGIYLVDEYEMPGFAQRQGAGTSRTRSLKMTISNWTKRGLPS